MWVKDPGSYRYRATIGRLPVVICKQNTAAGAHRYKASASFDGTSWVVAKGDYLAGVKADAERETRALSARIFGKGESNGF